MKTASRLIRILSTWLPPLSWAAIIFVFSAYPTVRTSSIHWQDFMIKKTAHLVEYGVLAGLLYRAFKKDGIKSKNAGLYAIFLSLLYGATDEFHQSFTPGREPRVRDVIFDTIGAILAIYALWNLLPKAPKKLRAWAERLELL